MIQGRNTWISELTLAAAAAALLLGAGAPSQAGQPIPAAGTITPLPSISLGVGPTFPADPADIVNYEFPLQNGQSFTQTIPVQICLTSVGSTTIPAPTSYSITIGPNAVGGDLSADVTLSPATVTFTSPACQTIDISLSTPALNLTNPNVAQIFTAEINDFSQQSCTINGAACHSSGNSDISTTLDKPHNIHVHLNVFPVGANFACYMSDSDGNFLLDAPNGNPATQSGSNAGVFAIVANKKGVEVATNPGQFYYNFVYANSSGAATNVVVDMRTPIPTGVVANGTNAVHSGLFGDVTNANFQSSFECANDGSGCYSTPWGASGVVPYPQPGTISVPNNMTLLVTYHLEWASLKKPWSAGCSGSPLTCPISVTGALTVNGTTVLPQCTAGAFGYGVQ
jgi:hypothetical protein